MPALIQKNKKKGQQVAILEEIGEAENDSRNSNEDDDDRSVGISTSKEATGGELVAIEQGREKIIRLIEHNFKQAEIVHEGSSIGSSLNNQFAYKDALKKIRFSIKSKSAPMNLKLSMVLISFCLLLCIFMNILSKMLSDAQTNSTVDFVWDSKNLTGMLIGFNKLTSYLEYSRMQNNFSPSNNYELIYSQTITDKIYEEANRTLDTLMKTKDYIMARSLKSREITPLLQFFFYQERDFLLNNRLISMPTLTFLERSINIFYSYIKNGFGKLPAQSKEALDLLGASAITNNENVIFDFDLAFFKQNELIAQDLANLQRNISLGDIVVRCLVVLITLCGCIPMMYVSMEKSNEILQMISKITMYNIQFYNNHYNKLITFLNTDGTQMETTVEKVSDIYRIGLREKEKKERQNRVKLRMKGSRDYKKKKTLWIVSAVLILLAILGIQSPRAILTLVNDYAFSTSVNAIIKIPNSANSYSAINTLSFKMMYYQMMNLTRDDQFQKSFALINKFFSQTVESKDTIGESRLQIRDNQFEDIFNKLFSQNMCTALFDPREDLLTCDSVVEKYAKHNLKAMFSFYQTSSWSKITYIDSKLSSTQVKDLIRKSMFMETFHIFTWFEQAVLIWDLELIQQTIRVVDYNAKITLYLCVIEVVLCSLLILTVIFYIYPKAKNDVLYSLSFLLLIPFHIFKENEMFSQFLKKKIKFNGMI